MYTPPAASKIRFANFEVDLRSGELRKHGHRIKLQDQPFKILAALLEQPGELVSRDELRLRIWGEGTFVDFDHGLSAAVNRLRDALGDSASNPRYVETVARRGYRFVAAVEAVELDDVPQPPLPAPPPAAPSTGKYRLWAAALAVTLLLAAGLGFYRSRLPASNARIAQVTALTGSESMPSLSPDGRQVAFVWNGEKELAANIFVKLLGSEASLQLTHGPGADLLPSWSPDGRHIAFVRVQGVTTLFTVSPLGGPERRIHEFPGLDRRPPGPETRIVGDLLYPLTSRPSWSPDSKFIALVRRAEPPEPGDGAVLLIPVDGGPPRTLLPSVPSQSYRHPTFSPDGRQLALDVCGPIGGEGILCQLQIIPLNPDLTVAGQPRTVHSYSGQLRGLAWMPGGEALIVSGFNLPHFYAWRIPTHGSAPPERLDLAGIDAIWPSVSQSGGRLAFARNILQADLWRWDRGAKPHSFLSSTARDTFPQLSPDGARVAFQSGRSGINEIWAANLDGSGLLQLTHRDPDGNSGAPSWSPDGRSVAYDSARSAPGSDIWVVDSRGGAPRKLTQPPGHFSGAFWSRDGKFIYASSTRSGRYETWRIPAAGGDPVQITRTGAVGGRESVDGATLFYTKPGSGGHGLYALPLKGGPEKELVTDELIRFSFAVVPEGIYYITGRDENLADLRFYDFAAGRARTVEALERPIAFGLSVTPDQKTFVYSRPVTGSDLLLIENFH